MSKMYTSAKGKAVDFNALTLKNERVPAVGNMSVNARGDVIDKNGNIITPRNTKVSEHYAKTVGNKTAQVKRTVQKEEMTKSELDLESQMSDDLEVEEIKKKHG